MTQTRIAKAAAALILTSIAGLATAAGTQQIDVSATVNTVCKFTTGSALSLTFNAIDPSAAGPATKSVDVPFQCTKGTADTSVTVTGGGSSLVNGSDSMAYSMTVGAIPTGTGFSGSAAATKVTVTGSIPATSYADAKALTYTDTVTLTINH
jgi:hypothetical protein